MVGTVDEYVEMARRPKDPERAVLTQFDADLVGNYVRFDIPMLIPRHRFKEVADMLRGLANTIEFAAQRTDLPERTLLFEIKMQARGVRRRIREMTNDPGNNIVKAPRR